MVKLLCPVVFAKILYGVFFHSKIMYSWYIYVICGLYVLFYCSCKWLSRFDALKAITINAAKHIGVSDRVGSIEIGKDADFVIAKGNPMISETKLDFVIIDGVIRYSGK